MLIFDFITQDEIDELPDDNPQAAFIMFVRIAQRRLEDRTKTIDGSDQPQWHDLCESRHSFMNVVVAAAKNYEIKPFASTLIPSIRDFDENTNQEFMADLDHYLTQLVLDNSSRAKRASILVPADLKSTIRSYVFHLREHIEKADDLDPAKREILLHRLTEFEAELEKRRLNLLAVTVLAITFFGAPGALSSSADVANRIMTNILRVVGDAKMADDAMRRLPLSEAPKIITGPRPEKPNPPKTSIRPGMDDEIPF